MESLSDMMKNNPLFNAHNERNEETYEMIINSPKFRQFVNDSGVSVTREMIQDELLMIKKFVEQDSECVQDENGHCKSHPDGYVINLEVRNGKIHHYLTPCKVKVERDKYKEKQKLIQSFFISQDIVNAHFDDLDIIEGSNREEVIHKSIETVHNIVSKNDYRGLYIHGNFGVGKSFFLGSFANELKEKNVSSMIIYVPELLQELRAGFKDNTSDDRIRALKEADVLMLDDLGAEDITAWSRDTVLTPILQSRMAEKRPTFISSNYSIDQLVDLYAVTKDGTVDKIKATRMVERIRALTYEVELVGPNYRH
uniref:primosomal protein DnaI n=1 Tax=Nosocomiicoccus ampullae TaxID=489910 RepID=UPI00082C0670|nr:primosomal protein DnaI [Nosocomiicoccus ampullae]